MPSSRKTKVRNLPRAKPSFRVAVCIDTRDGPGRDRLAGVYKFATQRKWQLSLIRQDDELHLRLLRGTHFDGAITFDRNPALHRMLSDQGTVCIEAAATHLPLAQGAVFVDDAQIGRTAYRHLAEAGFERFAYCGVRGSYVSGLRADTFVQNARASAAENFVFQDHYGDGQAALGPLLAWIKKLPKPVGILAFDDKMAMRVMAACHQANLAIPAEVGLLGLGNDELLCELTDPALSSLAVPTREVGWRAAQMLAEFLDGHPPNPPRVALAPLDIVVRASTDRVRGSDELVGRAIEFLRAHAHTPIGTAQVAENLAVARRTLERRFQNETGKTLHDFLTEFRLRRAKRTLRQFDTPLEEIARASGYSAVSAFIRMFAQSTGVHPRDYRLAHTKR
jgi:LacI family transcriptional regulator